MALYNDCRMMNMLEEVFGRLPNAPYLFIGSGFSRRYCDNAPSWRELLMSLAQETRPTIQYPLRSYEMEVDADLSTSQRYAQIASKIEEEYNALFFQDRIERTAEHDGIDYEEQSHLSPFRTHLAGIMKKTCKRCNLPSYLQEELSDLKVAAKHSINGVITTNFDGFAESLFPDFEVYRGQEDLIVTQATGYAEIYKIHGDYENPEGMIFTQKDYDSFEDKKAYLVSKLLSIFVENPLIIMGYSLSDDNIRGILESIAGCLSKKRLRELGEHIIFVEYNENVEKPEVSGWSPLERYKDFFVTAIRINSYGPILKQMIKLRRRYPLHLLRRIKQDIYKTVIYNEPRDAIRVFSADRVLENGADGEVGIIGFTHEGRGDHIALNTEDVYYHFLFPDNSINYESFVRDWLPKKLNGTDYPVFFYVRKYYEMHKATSALPDKVREYMCRFSGIDSFLNTTLVTKRKPNRAFSSIRQLREVWESEKDKLVKLALLDAEELDNGKLYEVLRMILKENPQALTKSSNAEKSHLRRLIRMCDYVENAKAVLQKEDGIKDLRER